MYEMTWDYPTGANLYSTRFQLDGDVFLADGASDEVWGTGGRDADDYDVAMAEVGTSGHYVGHFDNIPNIGAGTYKWTIRVRATGVPLDTDKAIAKGVIGWDGTAERHPRINEILSAVIEGTITLQQAQRLFLAAFTGKSSGGGSNTHTYRDTADSKDRIVATTDENDNRTAVVRDVS